MPVAIVGVGPSAGLGATLCRHALKLGCMCLLVEEHLLYLKKHSTRLKLLEEMYACGYRRHSRRAGAGSD